MEQIQTLNGVPLKKQIARALFKQKVRALLLIAPLLIFILITFVVPITDMLMRSVDNSIVSNTLPQTTTSLETWDPKSGNLPDEAAYAALYNDLQVAIEQKNHTKLGSRLNYESSGMSSLFRKVGKDVSKMQPTIGYKEQFIAADKAWGDIKTWTTFKLYSPKYTNGYFLAAIDMKKTPDGAEMLPASERIYLNLFVRTIFMSLVITGLCLLLGYPIAWLLANLPMRTSNLLMILVLLPFWTSLLVRTSAWKVLLQQQGVINDILVWLGIVSNSGRLELINNQFGTLVAMTHILLPFMILPLYSVMRTIPPTYVRAAKSLGATDWTTFWRVYFPQTIAGIGAGAILTFILAIGYYITPELVGGTQGTFISNRIAYHISSSLNWGMAAALGTILLTLVLVLYWVYDKIVGIDKVKLG